MYSRVNSCHKVFDKDQLCFLRPLFLFNSNKTFNRVLCTRTLSMIMMRLSVFEVAPWYQLGGEFTSP